LSTFGNISDTMGIMVKPVKRKAIALPAMVAVSKYGKYARRD
jgi:hypothetical protein